jgi:hypothetical protein
MMKKAIILIALLVGSWACTDVIDVSTPNREASIAIEGGVTNENGTEVRVSLTAGYFQQGATPVITDATVQVLEDGVVVSTLGLDDEKKGIYRSSFTGEVGRSYQVRVDVPLNSTSGFKMSTWLSKPETMNRIFELDSFNIRMLDRTTQPNVFTPGPYALVYFQEPEGAGDVYRFRSAKNDTLDPQSIQTFNDEFVDGGYFGGPNSLLPAFAFYGPLEKGDTVSITFSSISKEYEKYLALIAEQIFQVGSPFSAPPAAVIGNIYNEDYPDEFGFGYFVATARETGGIRYK